jgi:5-methylcytosine-specific restriction endonuclease McrA
MPIYLRENCLYPNFVLSNSYRKGCRCEACYNFNSERHKKYRQENKKYFKDYNKKYRQKNKKYFKLKEKEYRNKIEFKIKKRERDAKRREIIKNFISPEEKVKILELYKKCQLVSENTGISHHVDHIIPLCIGGKHEFKNLRIITAEENIRRPKDGSDILSA